MQNVLKGWLADNTLTADNKEDKILVLESAGNLSLTDVLSEMKKEDTGLRTETLEHVTNLFLRKVAELILNGYSVNTGLFRAVPQFKGIVEGGVWDSKRNSIYVSLMQDKDLREAIAATSVKILGEKGDAIYLIGSEDTSTRATNGTATAGRNFRLRGHLIKIMGDAEKTGISLTNSKGVVTKLAADMIAVNNPSELILLIPTGLADGDYTLTVTTQFSGNTARLLKEPRSVSRIVTLGGGEEEGDDPTV